MPAQYWHEEPEDFEESDVWYDDRTPVFDRAKSMAPREPRPECELNFNDQPL